MSDEAGKAETPEQGGAEISLADYRAGDEEAIAQVLESCQREGWGDATWWRWKHGHRPGFRDDEVLVARADGKAIGCFHGGVLELKLEAGLHVPVSFDGDFAVLPAYRGHDVAVRAHDLTDERLRARHVVFRGGFTSRELNERLYHRRFGYVFVPSVTTQFRRYLGPGPLAPRVKDLGARLLERPALRRALRHPLVVDLEIESFPPCHVVLAASGFRLERGAAESPNLRVRMPYGLLTRFAGGELPPPGVLFHAVGRGELAAKGLLRSAPRVLALALAVLRR